MANVEQELREEIRKLREDRDELRKQVQPSNGNDHGTPVTAPEKAPGKSSAETFLPLSEFPSQPISGPDDQRGFIRSHPIKVVVGLIVLVGLAIGGYFLLAYLNSYESTDDAQIDGHLNMIGTRIAGTITSVLVQENQQVQKGQVLAEIDPSDYQVALQRVEANLAQSQAQLRAANPTIGITQTTSETTVSTSQAEILEAQASVGGAERDYQSDLAKLRDAEANYAKAKADLSRYQQLVAKGT